MLCLCFNAWNSGRKEEFRTSNEGEHNEISNRICISVCMFALSFNSSFAQGKADLKNIVGTWQMESEGRNGRTRNYECFFSAEDGDLTAKIPMRRRGGEGGTTQEIKGVQFDGENLSFSFKFEGRDGSMTVEYKAKIEGGKMSGTMGVGERWSREFKGVKG